MTRQRRAGLAAGILLAGCGHVPAPTPAVAVPSAAAPTAPPFPGAPAGDTAFFERKDVLMGTNVEIVIVSAERERAAEASSAALKEIARIEELMTDWRETSQLSAINRAAGVSPVKVDRELLELLERSKEISELTGGAFDVTYAGAGRLWDFQSSEPHLPDPEEIRRALSKIDYKKMKIDFDRGTAFLEEPGMRIGLGGIAKGYAVGRASDLIKRFGFDDFAIKAGGDMSVRGMWNKKPWSVGIRDPRNRDASVAILPVANVAISTSGDYERYFELDGKRYGHIIDPRTGYPVDHTESVTIVSRDCTFTDGLAKGVFVLGAKEGMALIESIPGVEGVIIDAKGAMHVSRGLAKR